MGEVKKAVSYWVLGIIAVLWYPDIGKAEIYVAAMGGYSLQSEFTNVVSLDEFPGTPIPDTTLGHSGMFGGKVGFYLPDHGDWCCNWLGFETEAFFTSSAFPLFERRGVDSDLDVTTLGLNALFRYPDDRVQPYFGIGVGIFFAEIDADIPGPSLSSNAVPGLNVLGGVRGFVTDSIALFLEYKFNYATFKFRTEVFDLPFGFEGTYTSNIIAGGLSYHF